MDSWQPLPNYAGEVFFFTLADSAAIAVEQLRQDCSWNVDNRLAFASKALRALADLQAPVTPDGEPLIHRALDSETVRVRADGSPLFAGWRWARLPLSQTIAPGSAPVVDSRYAAPEVRNGGLATALPSSDVYSLCVVLTELKAVISYILFGLYSCEDLHTNPDQSVHSPADHAFDRLSEKRQGDLLRELARLDPGLESHARVDRYLSGREHLRPLTARDVTTTHKVALLRLEWREDERTSIGRPSRSKPWVASQARSTSRMVVVTHSFGVSRYCLPSSARQ